MFRKHPLQQLRYGVCVLEAEEPEDCPSKVKLFVRKHHSGWRVWAGGYKKVATFRFAAEGDPDPFTCLCLRSGSTSYTAHLPGPAANTSDVHSPITCTSLVTGLDLEPLLRAYGRWNEGTEMRLSIIRWSGWKTTMCVPLEDFLQPLARRGQEGKKFILRLSEEDVAVENVLTLPVEVENVREKEHESWGEEDRKDQEGDREKKSGRGEEKIIGEEKDEVQGNTREKCDNKAQIKWEGNEAFEETRKDEIVLGRRMNGNNTPEERRAGEEQRLQNETRETSGRRIPKENRMASRNEGIEVRKDHHNPHGMELSEITHQIRFAALVFQLVVASMILVLALLVEDQTW